MTDDVSADEPLPRVLLIGLPASAVDRSLLPEDITEDELAERIERGFGAVRDAGFDAVNLLVMPEPEAAASQLTVALARGPYEAVLIGGGIRMMPPHTLLFERLINELREHAPSVAICFNTQPTNSIDALRRVLQS